MCRILIPRCYNFFISKTTLFDTKEQDGMTKTIILAFIVFIFGLAAMPEDIVAQQKDAKSLIRSDVVLNSSQPSIFSCFEDAANFNDSSSIWIRVVNNSIWTLQFPANARGSSHAVQKLSNGRDVAMLAKGSIFYPDYGLVSDSRLRVITPISIYLGTNSFLPSNSSAVFSVPKRNKKKSFVSGFPLRMGVKYGLSSYTDTSPLY